MLDESIIFFWFLFTFFNLKLIFHIVMFQGRVNAEPVGLAHRCKDMLPPPDAYQPNKSGGTTVANPDYIPTDDYDYGAAARK